MKQIKFTKLIGLSGLLFLLLSITAFKSIEDFRTWLPFQTQTFDDFRKKPYYTKIFNAKDQKNLEKAYKSYMEGEKVLKAYQDLNKEVEQLNQFAASSSSGKDKILKKAEKAEKKALKKGFAAMDNFSQANNQMFEIYSRNILPLRKTGTDRYNFAAKLEKEANDDFNSGRSLNVVSKSSKDRERFVMLKQANELQISALRKFEQAFGVYSDDASIIPIVEKKDSVILVVDNNNNNSNNSNNNSNNNNSNNNSNQNQVLKTDIDYNPLTDSNLYISKENFIFSKLKLTDIEKKQISDSKVRTDLNNKTMENIDIQFAKIDSINELSFAQKDQVLREELKKKAEPLEQRAFIEYLAAIKNNLAINEVKYGIYKKHFPDVRPKQNNKDLQQGKKYETDADLNFAEAKKIISQSNSEVFISNQCTKLLSANNQQLLALQNQENAYSIYLKQPVNKIDTAKVAVDKNETADDKKTTEIKTTGTNKYISAFTYTRTNPKPKPLQVKKGTVFKIQIGVFKDMLSANKFDEVLMPLTGERFEKNSNIRFMLGEYRTNEAAESALEKVKKNGYKEAYIIAYVNGVRTNYFKARDAIKKDDAYRKLAEKEIAKIEGSNSLEEPFEETDVTNIQSNGKPDEFARGKDIKTVKGTVYLVQIGAYFLPRTNAELHNISPLFVEKLKDGSTRYLTGTFKTEEEAYAEKKRIINNGLEGVFVVGYKDGVQVKTETSTTNNNAQIKEKQTASVKQGGIVFKIQVGAYKDKLPAEKEKKFATAAKGEKVERILDRKGLHVYTIGSFTSYNDALSFKDELVGNGIHDGFVVAYKGKDKIPVKEAIKLQN